MDLPERCSRVRIPVLLAYGARDLVVPVTQGEELACALQDGRLVRVAGGTHLSTPLEPETMKHLIRWFRETQ